MRIDPSSLISAQAARAQAGPPPAALKTAPGPQFEAINFRKPTEESSAPKSADQAALQRPGTLLDIKV
jgi:hypothetical protein